MLRSTHQLPTLSALRFSLIPTIDFSSSSQFHRRSTLPVSPFLPKAIVVRDSTHFPSLGRKHLPPLVCRSGFRAMASVSSTSGCSSGNGKEILVQHLLVKEDDLKLLVELQRRIWNGEDMGDLAVEYSICPSKQEGGMLGWVGKGQMVPEFEEAAFGAPIDKVVRCKTKFGWHLLQVLSEREVLAEIQPDELKGKLQDPTFLEEAQLIDVREPEEIAAASLPGFQVLPLRQFGSWAPDVTTKFDPHKDTFVLCHHGVRSLQVAKWLQTQGFKRVFNVAGGIHAYAVKADPSIPTY